MTGARPREDLFAALIGAAFVLFAAPQTSAASTPVTPPKSAARSTHVFTLGRDDFQLDGRPFQILSCELHPSRIPAQYWSHRIRMAKAMGCNTIAAYVFWNAHETAEGVYDFRTGNRNLARFLQLVKEEGMWALLRPGPYVCAEWDFGGLPAYLLRDPLLRIRSSYPGYTRAAERYLARLAVEVRPLLIANGGPILMLQIENEYGSYGNDRAYLEWLRRVWLRNGVPGPFFTGDGPTPHMLEAGSLEGAAVGLDSGSNASDFELARRLVPGVPVFSSETYPGWLTHWGEAWAAPPLADLLKEVDYLLQAGKSFNFYVAHGGTNFGFTAGANSGGKGYEPDVTSYDYDAPIDEQGRATPKYFALRERLAAARPKEAPPLPDVPGPIPSIDVAPFAMERWTSVFDHLGTPERSVHPRPFEMYGQNQGLMLYRTRLVGRKSGRLTITEPHDFALVFVDGRLAGTLDRRLGEKTLELPATTNPMPVLDILIEGMGHINFAQEMIDRKGITDRVTLSGMTLMNWEVYRLPLSDAWMSGLRARAAARATGVDAAPASDTRPGVFFRGSFTLEAPRDTFLDLAGYRKGVVWVNGHNLGRYWDIGPQTRLYCPASFLLKGANEVIVLDLLKTDAAPLRGAATLR